MSVDQLRSRRSAYDAFAFIVGSSNTILDRWLFRPGGKYNCALARIAIAAALWLTINHNNNFLLPAYNWESWIVGMIGSGWSPKGLVKLADWIYGGIPPAWTYWLTFEIARFAIILMAIGLFVPLSQIVATIAVIYCVSLQTSFGPYWSHAYNVQCLAALAFMFARSADVLSVDAWLRQKRGHSALDRGNVYWWPVIFAELATALFMFGAFYQKFRETGFYWALSDNIRNSLGITWFQYRADPPFLANWIGSDPFIWKTAGMLQLFTQSTTILACFLVAYPIFRLIFGGIFFLIEILALAHVFRFWHPFWIPLCFLSIDYEHFWRSWKAKKERSVARPTETKGWFPRHANPFRLLFTQRLEREGEILSLVGPPLPTIAFVLSFGAMLFGYYFANLHWRLGEKHLNYPFSSMAFYSETRAMKPYDNHRYWPIYTGRIDVYESAGDHDPVKLWYREGHLEDQIFRISKLTHLRAIEKSASARREKGLFVLKEGGGFDLRPVHAHRVVYRSGLMAVTPFPQKLDFVDLHMGLRAVEDEHGWRALVTRLNWDASRRQYMITIEHEGFKSPEFEILARTNVREAPLLTEPEPLAGTWENNRFYVKNSGDARFYYVLIKVRDRQLGIEEIYYGPDNFQTYR